MRRSCSGAIRAWPFVAMLLTACGSPSHDPRTDDTPIFGHVLILADEDLRSLVEREQYVFESIYTKAELEIRYLPEAALLKAVMNDTVRCWIATVQPGGEQGSYYLKRTVKAHVVPICTDGIAVIVSDTSELTSISRPALQRLLLGGEGGHALMSGAGSGVARTLVDSVLSGSDKALRAQALPSVEEVVEHVRAGMDAIGLIPFAAISDLDDPHALSLRKGVRILPVSMTDGSPAFLPDQGTLADATYPLRRSVYMVLCEGKSGLGTGFVSFVANHKGQRILLKSGVAPQHIPARDVEIVN